MSHAIYTDLQIKDRQSAKLKEIATRNPRYKKTFERAFSGKSLRAAVRAMCIECIGFEFDAVVNCTAPECPLFNQRPGAAKPVGRVPSMRGKRSKNTFKPGNPIPHTPPPAKTNTQDADF